MEAETICKTIGCAYRTGTRISNDSRVPFCSVGYSQNPSTRKAFENAKDAGAKICNKIRRHFNDFS